MNRPDRAAGPASFASAVSRSEASASWARPPVRQQLQEVDDAHNTVPVDIAAAVASVGNAVTVGVVANAGVAPVEAAGNITVQQRQKLALSGRDATSAVSTVEVPASVGRRFARSCLAPAKVYVSGTTDKGQRDEEAKHE